MTRTDLFDVRHLEKCYSLQKFCKDKDIDIAIKSDYRMYSKLDINPTEFLFIEYPNELELLIQYWVESNNIRFYNKGELL